MSSSSEGIPNSGRRPAPASASPATVVAAAFEVGIVRDSPDSKLESSVTMLVVTCQAGGGALGSYASATNWNELVKRGLGYLKVTSQVDSSASRSISNNDSWDFYKFLSLHFITMTEWSEWLNFIIETEA